MRVLFMGTPEFAAESLRALCDAGHEVCGVFSQPDKPKNRGMKLQPTAVKEYALSQNIPVFQPSTLRDGSALEEIRRLEPQLIAVAAYGRILPGEMLDFPPLGCVNVHSSLLPKYRGAAPINWAVLEGEEETGVTIMHMAPELDAGDIILQRAIPIRADESVESVHNRLALLGGQLLVEAVAALEGGTAPRIPQEHGKATYAPMLSRALSPIDWTKPARTIYNQVRGLVPWPATTTDLFSAAPVKVLRCQVLEEHGNGSSGRLLAVGKAGIDVVCGDGQVLRILELQAQGGRRMTADEYLRGHPIAPR